MRGLKFQDLTPEQLEKASKRYPSDPKLQKYAKAVVASRDLDGEEGEPEPCLPLAVRQPAQLGHAANGHGWLRAVFQWLLHLNLHRAVITILVCTLLVFILKPSLATACTKVVVQFVRLMLRRVTAFLVMLLEGLPDELVYQIEFSIRQAIPPMDFEQFVQAPFNFVSHIISAMTGAGITMLTHYMQARRNLIPAVD